MKRKVLYIILAIAFILLLINIDLIDIFNNIKNVKLNYLLLALLLQIVTMLLITLQWKSMINLIDKKCKTIDVLRMNLVGNIADSITPGVKVGGELARLYEIKKRLGLDISDSAVVVALQKTASILSFYSLTLISLVWFYSNLGSFHKEYMYLFLIAILLLGLGLAIIIISFFISTKWLNILINKLPTSADKKERFNITIDKYNNSVERFKQEKRNFIIQILLGLIIWLLFAFKMYIIITGLNLSLDIFSIGAITYLSYIIGMIPILPGSVGSFEASMTALLTIKGLTIEEGATISVVFRFITFWFEFFISLIFISIDKMLLKIRRKKSVRHSL